MGLGVAAAISCLPSGFGSRQCGARPAEQWPCRAPLPRDAGEPTAEPRICARNAWEITHRALTIQVAVPIQRKRPRVSTPVARHERARAPTEMLGPAPRILLAEDDGEMRSGLVELFVQQGYKVSAVGTGSA